MYFSAQLIYFYSFIYFILLLGHPYKMFRFPLLHLLWWWVGLLPKKKKNEHLKVPGFQTRPGTMPWELRVLNEKWNIFKSKEKKRRKKKRKGILVNKEYIWLRKKEFLILLPNKVILISAIAWGGAGGPAPPPPSLILTGTSNLVSSQALPAAFWFNFWVELNAVKRLKILFQRPYISKSSGGACPWTP